jgi:transcriptional regulator with XRE-family HTH domain
MKVARLRAGMSQRQLAEALGLPQSSIARWESGAREPTIESLVQAVRACGLDISASLFAMDRSNDAFIWELLDETPAERLRRQVAAANGRLAASFEPDAVLAALTREEVPFVLVGRLAENMRGCPLVPEARVEICLRRGSEARARLDRALRALGERRVEVAVVPVPHGTDGYGDLLRHATRETVAGGIEVDVASLLDLIRIADASVDPSDRVALPTLVRAFELQESYVPPEERERVVPEGLEELFAEHGVRS